MAGQGIGPLRHSFPLTRQIVGEMTVRTRNLLIVAAVVATAGWASFVVAEWNGYIKEPYCTYIKDAVNPPAFVGSAAVLIHKAYSKRPYIRRIR
jgi:hypothetical protein